MKNLKWNGNVNSFRKLVNVVSLIPVRRRTIATVNFYFLLIHE